MPNFEFSDEEKQLIETAREFARKEIVPVAGQLDEHGKFPTEICKKAWETGLMNCEIPEAYGGLGPLVPGALPGARGDLVRLHRRQHDDGRQHARRDADHHRRHRRAEEEVLRRACSPSRSSPPTAAREPDAGCDVAGMRTRYKKDGDDYVLTGQKRWITNGGVASFYTVFARDRGDDTPQGHHLLRRRPRTRPACRSARRRTRWASALATPPTSSSRT